MSQDTPQDLPLNDADATAPSGPLGSSSVRGILLRQIWSHPDGNWAVVRLKQSSGMEITLSGASPLAQYQVGDEIECIGRWETNAKYGRQFKADNVTGVLPNSQEGLIKYLSGGRFDGIGRKTAEAIVNHFGDETIKILSRYSVRLKEVPGLGPKKAAAGAAAWEQLEGRRELDVFLQSLGVPNGQCNKLVEAYGNSAPAILRENPYRLADEIRGMGFLSADRISASLGLPKDSPFRVAAGLAYTLKQASEGGHCFLPESELRRRAQEILGVPPEALDAGCERALKDAAALTQNDPRGGDEQLWYLRELLYAEEATARDLKRLAVEHPSPWIPASFSRDGLNAEQKQAVGFAFAHRLSILTGGPGCGKTTAVDEIVRQSKARGLKIILAAPTGRAARRMKEATGMEASTIHRLLMADEDGEAGRNRDNPLEADLIVIDECSMLDIQLASRLLAAIGDKTSLLLVGDADQLPSVGPGCFLRDCLTSHVIPVTRLVQVFRQAAASRIIQAAHAILAGRLPDLKAPPKAEEADFYWIEKDDPAELEDLVLRLVQERIPQRFGFRPQEIQVLAPMRRGSCGTLALNQLLQAGLNDLKHKPQFEDGDRRLVLGDRVMQISNNYQKKVFNGDLGYILDVGPKEFTVMFEDKNVGYLREDARELALAYAVTIHKSQGSEFPAVVVPLSTSASVMLQRNLLYTAVTRAKKLLVLCGSRKALEMCVRNARINHRFSRLAERLNADAGDSGLLR